MLSVTREMTKSTRQTKTKTKKVQHSVAFFHTCEKKTRTPKPLRRTSDRQAIMPRSGREYIRYVHPRQGAPPHRIKRNVYIQHRRHSLACGGRRSAGRRRRVGLQDRADDEEQGTHAEGRDEERKLTTKGLDEEEDEDDGGD